MNDQIPDLPNRMPAWKALRLVVRQLTIDQSTKDRNFLTFLAEVREALPTSTDFDVGRCMNGLETPSPALKRVIFRWCKSQIAAMRK